ncbi:MAG TPA: hypothetical protein VH877_06835 [Polyangia bacterium]|jgi:hypothetical protein|nr:hypothetical protein [Polyangia bacterium]
MGYHSFTEDTTFDEAREAAEFTVEALDSYPDETVRALTHPLQTLLEQAEGLAMAARRARRQMLRANARVRTGDGLADDEVREFVKDLLAAVRQDRSTTLYRAFFPQTPSEVIDMSLEPEIEELKRMMRLLEADSTPAALREVWRPRFAAVIARGLTAIDERKAALLAMAETTAASDRWMERVDRCRRGIDTTLIAYAADKGLPRDFHDRFFPGPPSRRRRV